MNKKIIILSLFLSACCASSKRIYVENNRFNFNEEIGNHAPYLLDDSTITYKINKAILKYYELKKIKYYKTRSRLISIGKYFKVALYNNNYSGNKCDSMQMYCEDTLAEIYKYNIKGDIETSGPCGCKADCCPMYIIYLDSLFNIVATEKNK